MRLYLLTVVVLICILTLVYEDDDLFQSKLADNVFLFGQALFLWSLWSRGTNWKLIIQNQVGLIASLCSTTTSTPHPAASFLLLQTGFCLFMFFISFNPDLHTWSVWNQFQGIPAVEENLLVQDEPQYDAQLLALVEVISDDDSSDEDDHLPEGWLNEEWLIRSFADRAG